MSVDQQLRKQIAREFPELVAGYHLPIMAEVESINDYPNDGGISDSYRPRYAVDVILLKTDYSKTSIKLDAVPVSFSGGGDGRGFFSLPEPGTIIELAFMNGSPERPFVRSILGDRQALPWIDEKSMSWQQSEQVKQSVDRSGHWKRVTNESITDKSHQHNINTKYLEIVLGREVKRILEHSYEDIDGMKVIEASAINDIAAMVINQLSLGNINQQAAGVIARSATGKITDQAKDNIELLSDKQLKANAKLEIKLESDKAAEIKSKKIFIGDSENLLKLLSDVIAELSAMAIQLSTLTVTCTAPGSVSSVPVNAAAFTTSQTKIDALKSKLDAITK